MNSIMCCFVMRIHSEKRIVREFCHCANTTECTYTRLDDTAHYTQVTYVITYRSVGEEKYFFSTILSSWLRHPWNKKQINRRKTEV